MEDKALKEFEVLGINLLLSHLTLRFEHAFIEQKSPCLLSLILSKTGQH